ncbi:MAG: putative signal transduction protein [Bacillales bacterium]|jgi:diguanylate cyclase (GGDEF)-like protein|nr:putative signal transduction protein [Bacillales bacterium]
MNEFINEEEQRQIDKLKAFENMYDFMRFVDPVKKRVITFTGDEVNVSSDRCFDTWEKGRICNNCISIRAYNDNQTYVKIEYSTKRVFMVTAMPIELNDRNIVLEIMKDATKSIVIENVVSKSSIEIHSLIDQLNAVALKDPLTEGYNRRFINERLPIDILDSVMSEKNLTLIMCDLDNFKNINDSYGHLAGDNVIKRFNKIIEYCLRKNDDWSARFGGEEFIVCLKNTDVEQASHVAERIRKTLEEECFLFSNESVRVTASFGLASIKEIEIPSLEGLIDCADKKLYLAKSNGRNRVEK